MNYVNLHLHTDASHLDGLNDIPRLMKRLKEIGAEACAITDHGNMHNVLKFYRACKENDIKPILGFEAYVSHNHTLHSKSEIEAEVERTGDEFVRFQNHLVLLAKDFKGYQNLLRLTTIGFTDGFYRKPTIDFELLKQYSEGIICINGHVGTDIARAFERYVNLEREERYDEASLEFLRAYDLNDRYKEVFGDDYYLEIQNHGLRIEADVTPLMIDLAKADGVTLVMTNDSHYTWRTDGEPHRIHMSNGIGRTLDEFMNSDFEGFKDCDEFYVKDYVEMAEMAFPYGSDAIQALNNTVAVADKCNVEIEALKFGGMYEENGKKKGKWSQKEYLFPNFPIPAPFANIEAYFRHLSIAGLEERFNKGELYGIENGYTLGQYEERLEYEMGVVLNMGFPTYFIILWDSLKFCRDQDIPVGKGRGSGAGSLVLYALRITDIDPLPYQLIFERFLNPSRISMPDVDTDFCYDRIGEVIDYIKEKYGNGYVCKIGTFGTLGAKAVLKDVSRVLQYPFDKINAMTRQVTDISISITNMIEKYPDIKQTYEEDKEFQRIVTVGKRLEGLQRHSSQHAAGVVISPFPLTDLIPLKGDSDDLTSQWEMGDIELLGFVKMDFLKLRTLTVVKNALKSIERATGEVINIDKIPLDDEAVYAEFHKGNSLGIFQFESDGMQALLKKHKPKTIEDLTADNALYRPGPMDAKVEDEENPNFGKTMMEVYVDRASGEVPVEFDHPLLQRVQGDTYGVFVYQEQIMNGSVVLADYTLPESDELRKVVGKKLMDKMPQQHKKFVDGCESNPLFINGCSEIGKQVLETAEMIWKQIETFGRYGFNKSHSTSYADLAYRAMWLKVHHPAHFMAAVLTSWMGAKIEDLVPYLNECRRMNIKILPPDVNQSGAVFVVSRDGKGIHFGLTGIKGVGEKAVQNILEIKATHAINSLSDFMSLTGSSVNKTVVSSLIKAGAFDFLGFNRRTLLQMSEELLAINSKIKTKITNNAKRKNPVSDISAFYEPLYDFQPTILGEFTSRELADMERELTGFYMAHHPLDGFVAYIRAKATHTSLDINRGVLSNAYDLEIDEYFAPLSEQVIDNTEPIYVQLPKGQTIITGGVVKQLNLITLQNGRNKGKQMATFIIEDAYQGDIRCTAFAEVYGRSKMTIKDGNVILMKGNIDYFRENAQINVTEVKEINTDTASKYEIKHDYEKEIRDVLEMIILAEETIELIGVEDMDMISAVCEELIVLYDKRDELTKLANKESVA